MSENTICKFSVQTKCNTIVDPFLGSCEMCCDEAIAERVARVTPINEREKKENEARDKATIEALKAKQAAMQDEAAPQKKAK